ncbi:fructosamine kinase family protein [Rhodovulum euryhalinum]|uniref:Fructosamine-3-kinase n=1 Tax=Rhodovulum euryhalinum TaxID=35805 RepID=A0A4V2S9V0_9RHOB|nr:fructosamine kinase family protein [Rhodovulum euryhalinum]TCO69310.1 fructosamine-3-kinase [Rhodovulum euryhalinum]
MADRAAIEALLGAPVAGMAPLHGGDLSEVVRVTMADGGRVVAKTGPMVAREARMLAAMARAGVPCPAVIAVADDLLVMAHLDETRARAAGWAALGIALARLHAVEGTAYGWDEDYAFGAAALPNAACGDWPEFWAARRLLAWPEALPADIAARVDRLAARLPDLLPRRPPCALLHGDLWAGNVLFTAGGAALIDPACYHGHAEVDLAMLHLFGRPGPDFAAAYGPPETGWKDRRGVYQLWPALVHLRLFGGGYRGMAEACLATVGA